jgi:hypothetical protein
MFGRRIGNKSNRSAACAGLESLETRQMFSAGVSAGVLSVTGTAANDTLNVSLNKAGGIVVNDNGTVRTFSPAGINSIRIDALAGNDQVRVSNSITLPCTITGGDGRDVLQGGGGADLIQGGTGQDRLYGGRGADTLEGGENADILVSLGGGTSDRLTGGDGTDTYWLDSNSGETITSISTSESDLHTVHRVAGFMDLRVDHGWGNVDVTPVSRELDSQNLPDPLVNSVPIDTDNDGDGDTNETPTYTDFSTSPLFNTTTDLVADIDMTDVNQGGVGDCYMLAAAAAIAKADPNYFKRHIVDLNDGTYGVRFRRDNQDVFVRVDGDLPTLSFGSLAYAKLGAGGSTWVAILEKAYAFFRSNAGTYDSLTGGWTDAASRELGLSADNLNQASTWWNRDEMMRRLKDGLDAGGAVTAGTPWSAGWDGTPVVASHAYAVDGFNTDSGGNITSVRLYNPWGIDGKPTGDSNPNDGFVTISVQRFWDNFDSFTIARF